MNRRRPREVARDQILSSCLFDQGWYEEQAGRRFASRPDAVEHFVRHSESGWSPHPLFREAWVYPRGGWRQSGLDPLSLYLEGPRKRQRATHPLLHLGRIVDDLPPAATDPLGPIDHWLRAARPDDLVPTRRGVVPITWWDLRDRLGSARAVQPEPGFARTVGGRVSVVLPMLGSSVSTVDWMMALFREHPALDLEIVVGAAAARPHRQLAAEVATVLPRAVVLAMPESSTRSEVMAAGLAAASGEHVIFLRGGLRAPYWSWVEPLVSRLNVSGTAVCQPLLLADDRTIASAGSTFIDGGYGETPLLHGMASADADRLGRGDIPGVSQVAAMRIDVARAVGLDHSVPDEYVETDLGVRAWRMGLGRAALAPRSRLVLRAQPVRARHRVAGTLPPGSLEAWALAGYAVSSDGSGRVEPRPSPRPRVVESPSTLRWTLDTAATDGPLSVTWGDFHFATSLAAALERRGQRVTVDTRESRSRYSRSLDDVVLVLRGRDQVVPSQSPMHLLWVLSHPGEVTAEEAARYDAVFAASARWAETRSKEWGLEIRPLLQCTDPELFHPDLAEPDSGPRVLCVANSRGHHRPAVAAALEAGCDLVLYGKGWEHLVPADVVRASHVPNRDLGALYGAAGVVLNDHWDDMRAHGFVSNRLFDAVACAARVASDDVAGLSDLFASCVRVFSSPTELRRLTDDVDAHFPDLAERRRVADRVARDHSFDRRAEELIDAVLSTPGSRL